GVGIAKINALPAVFPAHPPLNLHAVDHQMPPTLALPTELLLAPSANLITAGLFFSILKPLFLTGVKFFIIASILLTAI
ncbi:hypothetical protein, partial [Serratia sp. CY43514]|uniref:hypothetical protein n=1 Tax=Serratia sp. CY43514 TaxID=3383620 RepID=UPI0040251EE7